MFGFNKNNTTKNENDQVNMLEKLSVKMDNMRVAEYVEILNKPIKLIWMNFILGLARGLGMGIGLTILFSM